MAKRVRGDLSFQPALPRALPDDPSDLPHGKPPAVLSGEKWRRRSDSILLFAFHPVGGEGLSCLTDHRHPPVPPPFAVNQKSSGSFLVIPPQKTAQFGKTHATLIKKLENGFVPQMIRIPFLPRKIHQDGGLPFGKNGRKKPGNTGTGHQPEGILRHVALFFQIPEKSAQAGNDPGNTRWSVAPFMKALDEAQGSRTVETLPEESLAAGQRISRQAGQKGEILPDGLDGSGRATPLLDLPTIVGKKGIPENPFVRSLPLATASALPRP
jgi:hypothetical protein